HASRRLGGRSISRMSPAGDRLPSRSPRTRRGGSRRTLQVLDYPKAPAHRSTFTLTKYLKSYIPRFPRREMSFARAGKTAANEAKYPFIVEVPVAANGLNVEFEQSNCRFSQVVPRHAAIWTHCTPRRANLLPLVLFRFGDGARLCRTVWRSILQNNRHLTYATSQRRRPGGSRRTSPSCRSCCSDQREMPNSFSMSAIIGC